MCDETEEKADKGLMFTNSGHIDPLRRQCSIVTLQSEVKGFFAKLFDHMRDKTGNYVNVLLQISEKSNNGHGSKEDLGT
jgi:hypothetical protein